MPRPSNTLSRQAAGTMRVRPNGRFVYGVNRADTTTEFEGQKVFGDPRHPLPPVSYRPERAHAGRGAALQLAGEWLVTMPLGTPPFYFDAPTMAAEQRVPTRWDLDPVSPENPVYIQAIWGYWGWPPLVSVLNSRALEVCGITRHTQPPWDGVEILKDGRGEPTGVILEHHLVPTLEFTLLERAPRFTLAQRIEGLTLSMQRCSLRISWRFPKTASKISQLS